jgi:hypothetical protein
MFGSALVPFVLHGIVKINKLPALAYINIYDAKALVARKSCKQRSTSLFHHHGNLNILKDYSDYPCHACMQDANNKR